jgi:hypothetical protein
VGAVVALSDAVLIVTRSIPKVYDTPKGMRIYSWLRRQPPLAKVVGFDEADQEITVSLERESGSGSPKWKDAIGALYECVRMRGLNKAGEVVRTLSLDPDADPELASNVDTHIASNVAKREARETGSTLIAVDVPKLVESIAKNMQEVARFAAEQNSAAFSKGFEAMTDVVQLCIGMLQRVDARLEQAENAQPEVIETPNGEPDRNSLAHQALFQALSGAAPGGAGAVVNHQQAAMLMQLLQQHLGAQPPAAQPTEPNGHAQ